MASNDRILENNELKRSWKESEKTCKTTVRLIDVPAEIRTGHLLNTNESVSEVPTAFTLKMEIFVSTYKTYTVSYLRR
jgi:hypothetical protein